MQKYPIHYNHFLNSSGEHFMFEKLKGYNVKEVSLNKKIRESLK